MEKWLGSETPFPERVPMRQHRWRPCISHDLGHFRRFHFLPIIYSTSKGLGTFLAGPSPCSASTASKGQAELAKCGAREHIAKPPAAEAMLFIADTGAFYVIGRGLRQPAR